jgi:hypothetical protein
MTQLARVGVTAEAWQAFRQLALRRGLSVTAYLGKLVEQELRRYARTNLAEIPADAPPRDEAIAALDDVRRSIDELDDVAGRLARAAIAHGGTWADVGSSLRLRADVAESAHGRPPG